MLEIVAQSPLTSQFNPDRQFRKLQWQRWLTSNFFIFLLQYGGLTLSTLSSNPLPIWLATGIILSFVALRGYRILIGLWIGSVCAYVLAGAGWGLANACACLYTIQAVLFLWCCFRYIGPSLVFYNKKLFINFLLLSIVLSAAFSAVLLLTSIHNLQSHLSFTQILLRWWLANLNSILIFLFAFITLDAYFPQISHFKNYFKFKTILWLGLICSSFILLSCATDYFLKFIFLICGLALSLIFSKRYGWNGAVLANFLIGCSVCSVALLEINNLFPTSSFLFLQIFVAVTAVSNLLIGMSFTKFDWGQI